MHHVENKSHNSREITMHILHAEHPGMTRMKNLASTYIWWPSLDTEIEELVRLCEIYQTQRPALPHVPIQPLTLTTRKLQRVYMDLAQKQGNNFLILVYDHSKFIFIFILQETKAKSTFYVD
jgi:hypothetical protein